MIHLSPSRREIWALLTRSGWIILALIETEECQDEAIGLFEVWWRPTEATLRKDGLAQKPWFTTSGHQFVTSKHRLQMDFNAVKDLRTLFVNIEQNEMIF